MDEQFISNDPTQVSQGDMSTDIMSAFEVKQEPGQPAGSDNQGQVQQLPQIEIDPRFANLPQQEALIRTLQSRYDILAKKNEDLVRDSMTKSKYEQFVNELFDDDQIADAFISERRPELFQKKDISAAIQTKMKSEFGEDFVASREEADRDPGGKHWLYFKRLDTVLNEVQGNPAKIQTVKELKAERVRLQAEQDEKSKQVFDVIKRENNWSDVQVDQFYGWAQKLTPLDLVKIYKFAINTMRITPLSDIEGATPKMRTSRDAFLDSFK